MKSDAKEKNKSAGDLGPEFDLGFISHAESDTSLNHDVVRLILLILMLHIYKKIDSCTATNICKLVITVRGSSVSSMSTS